MRRLLTGVTVATLAVIVLSITDRADAQWPTYPWKNMPRTPDGEIDMKAPPRRMADGHIDLSGFWMPSDVVRHLLNLASDLKPEDVPLQPWAQALYKERIDNNGKEHPGVSCLPSGIPEKLNIPDGLKVVHSPDLLLFLHESRTIYRQVFTDGRPLPPRDVQPTWMGYSIGRWEGDTMVVETIGSNGKTWLDMRGLPGTDALHVIERYTRPAIGRIDIEVTIDDPKAYTKPFDAIIYSRIMPTSQLSEFVCIEKDAKHYVGAQPATPK